MQIIQIKEKSSNEVTNLEYNDQNIVLVNDLLQNPLFIENIDHLIVLEQESENIFKKVLTIVENGGIINT